MFTYSYVISFHLSAKYCTAARVGRSKYNAHAVNLAKLHRQPALIYIKNYAKTVQIIKKKCSVCSPLFLHLL